MPLVRYSHHVHVWRNLLERAGFTLADIPREWGPFWSFWCDKVQPAVRKVTGRDDIFGIGVAMSRDAGDTRSGLAQFAEALTRTGPSPGGRAWADDPAAQATLVEALRQYTAIYAKGCTPPQSVAWTSHGNNDAFLAQSIVMTINTASRSRARSGASGRRTPQERRDDRLAERRLRAAAAPRGLPERRHGLRHGAPRRDGAGVRALPGPGRLARAVAELRGGPHLPVLATLTDQPFWLDPGDPHRMSAVMQVTTHPHVYDAWGLPDAQRRFAPDYAWRCGPPSSVSLSTGLRRSRPPPRRSRASSSS